MVDSFFFVGWAKNEEPLFFNFQLLRLCVDSLLALA